MVNHPVSPSKTLIYLQIYGVTNHVSCLVCLSVCLCINDDDDDDDDDDDE